MTEDHDPPIAKLLSRKFEGVREDGAVSLAFMGREDFCNAHGVLQGGLVSAMLDATLGYALRLKLPPDQRFITIELSVRFIRPAHPGRLVGLAHILHRGRSTATIQGELRDGENRLLAHATSTKLFLIGRGDAEM